MARSTIVAPINPAIDRRKNIEALKKKPSMTPVETQRYIQLLEAEVTALRKMVKTE